MQSTGEHPVEYGCLSCYAGREKRLADDILISHPFVRAVVPEKIRYRRAQGTRIEERVLLFPGYVFFEADATFHAHALTALSSAVRLLCDGDGDWCLSGGDRKMIVAIFKLNGLLGTVKARYEGDTVRILDEPFEHAAGRILRVNRRAGTVQLAFSFHDTSMNVWMNMELMNP